MSIMNSTKIFPPARPAPSNSSSTPNHSSASSSDPSIQQAASAAPQASSSSLSSNNNQIGSSNVHNPNSFLQTGPQSASMASSNGSAFTASASMNVKPLLPKPSLPKQQQHPTAKKRSFSKTSIDDHHLHQGSHQNKRQASDLSTQSLQSSASSNPSSSTTKTASSTKVLPANDPKTNTLKSYLASFNKSNSIDLPIASARASHDSKISLLESKTSSISPKPPDLPTKRLAIKSRLLGSTNTQASSSLNTTGMDPRAASISPTMAPSISPTMGPATALSMSPPLGPLHSASSAATTSSSSSSSSAAAVAAAVAGSAHHGSHSSPRPRPIRSCTHCRQQKIKCNALEVFPAPCSRCAKADRKCVVDPLFKPHKGGQVQSLRDDISNLKQQLAALQHRESMLASVLKETNPDAAVVLNLQQQQRRDDFSVSPQLSTSGAVHEENEDVDDSADLSTSSSSPPPAKPFLPTKTDDEHRIQPTVSSSSSANQKPLPSSTTLLPASGTFHSTLPASAAQATQPTCVSATAPSSSSSSHLTSSTTDKPDTTDLPDPSKTSSRHRRSQSSAQDQQDSSSASSSRSLHHNIHPQHPSSSNGRNGSKPHPSASSVPTSSAASTSPAMPSSSSVPDKRTPGDLDENLSSYSRQTSVSVTSSTVNEHPDYVVGDVRLSYDQAEELHQRFMTQYLPFLPIIQSNSAAELYRQSQLLFWTVCLTASLSELTPTLYNSLCSLIKQLAIETCWIQTPRSTHIVQALLILGNWPLPNEKVLDDCSYRFITLAKSLAMQLGLHRGKFIYEFSRTQVSLPDAEKWRTRTWIAIFFMEQVWCANLGLPPNMPMDYLLEVSRTDTSLPKSFRSLACLAMFCSKLVNLMGSSVTSPDGTLEPKNRFSTLGILEQELDRLVGELGADDDVFVEIYSLYLKMMICVFSFLPETPIQDQTIYIIKAYHAATRVVTLFSGLAEKRRIIEYPIYIRHPVSLAGFILFRLHLSPLLLPQYVESARQSVVTVHRLFRNMLTAWKDVQNDISRTAKVLEKLNFVIITHPELFTKAPGIVTRMRSHLTASLFYELIWAIHEARRRGGLGSSSTHTAAFVAAAAAAVAANNGSSASANNILMPHLSFNSINSIPGSHVDSVPPLPFYNQITKDDFTTTTTTTPNGTTVTTLVPTNTNLAYNGANNNNDNNSQPITLELGPDGTPVNTTPLAGLGNPSTMLTKAGPDVAGSMVIPSEGENGGNAGSSGAGSNPASSGSRGSSGSNVMNRQMFPVPGQSSVVSQRFNISGGSRNQQQTPQTGAQSSNQRNIRQNSVSSQVSLMQQKQQQQLLQQFQQQLENPIQSSSSSPNAQFSQIPGMSSQQQQSLQTSTSSTNYSNTMFTQPIAARGQVPTQQQTFSTQQITQQLTQQLAQTSSHQQQQQPQQSQQSGADMAQAPATPVTPFYGTTGSSSDPLHLDTLMQGIDWMDSKGDDLLGWMDNLDFNMY